MAALGIVTNFIIGTKTNPLGDRSVLLGFLGQNFLDTESFLGRHSVAVLKKLCSICMKNLYLYFYEEFGNSESGNKVMLICMKDVMPIA